MTAAAQTTAGTAADGYRVQPQPIPRPRHGDDPREPGARRRDTEQRSQR